jgi:transcription elongation factor GreA
MIDDLSPTRVRLHAELEHLVTVELADAQQAVATAQSVGDITENTDVAIALGEVAKIKARMNQIRSVLSLPESSYEAPEGEVAAGRIVSLRFGDEDPELYLFGSVEDRHPEYSTLTVASPIGKAIVGSRAGAVLEVSLGGRVERVEIVSVQEQSN